MNSNRYSKSWHSGIPRGSVKKLETSYEVRIKPPDGKEIRKIFSFKKDMSMDEAYQKAEAFRKQKSDQFGITRNQIRHINKDLIEVKLSNDMTMKTNTRYKDKVLKYPLVVKTKKGTNSTKYYVLCQDKKNQFPFTNLICDFEQVEYINGDTLDLTFNNLRNRKGKGIKENYSPDISLSSEDISTDVEEPRKKGKIKIIEDSSEDENSDQTNYKECIECKHYKPLSDFRRRGRDTGKKCIACMYLNTDKANERRNEYFRKFKDLIEERDWQCLGTVDEYKTAYSKIKVKCQDGHEYEATLNNIKADRWCPECKTNMNELIAVKAAEHLFGKPFKKVRPKWLKTDSGTLLELDGFNKELKIAIEYNGKQHYYRIKHFQRSDEEFIKRIDYDILKEKLCTERGIHLISIPFYVSTDMICWFISLEAQKLGFDIKDKVKTFDIKEIKRVYSKTDAMEKLISEKGGMLINGIYMSQASPVEIECEKGHIWETKCKYIMKGAWCIPCSKQQTDESKKKISENLKKFLETEEGKQNKQTSHQKRSETMRKRREQIKDNMTNKECVKCQQVLPLTEFNKKNNMAGGYQSWCKECIKEYKRQYREKKRGVAEEFKCDQCTRTYKLKDSLTRHIREKHKNKNS